MTAFLDFGSTALAFVVLLTVLVFVHEMGHYLVARWCGVRVEVFSIGFGPELFGWYDRRQTRWKVSVLPLGGYVKFFGDLNASSAPDGEILDELTEDERKVAFHHKPLLQRVLIVVAGPLANILYSMLVLTLIFWTFGQRVTPPEIGRVLPDGAGQAAGFRQGDVVLAIDGDPVARYSEIVQAYLMNPERELAFLIRRQDQELTLTATPTAVITDELDGIERRVGELGLLPASRALVGKVRPGSAAEAAGFEAGDRIIEIDDVSIDSFEALQDIIKSSQGRRLSVTVRRDGEAVRLTVAARREVVPLSDGSTREGWFLGIESAPRPLVRYGPARAA
ncbi:MAG: RIP metalloprotease RseP, partial [Alphaproteobacteria bacterium]|nr:RIP metalloprotease RseP [Alphaproteobacteria bacterium]